MKMMKPPSNSLTHFYAPHRTAAIMPEHSERLIPPVVKTFPGMNEFSAGKLNQLSIS
jgi:hypothetical protein